MIVTENLSESLVKTYSDKNVYIKQVQTGKLYHSAIDTLPARYTYIETDKKIPERKILVRR